MANEVTKKGVKGFLPGHPKVGGRKKGTPNKTTKHVRDMLTEFLEAKLPEMHIIYESIDDPFTKAKVLLMIAKLVLPDIKAIEAKITEGEDKSIQVFEIGGKKIEF